MKPIEAGRVPAHDQVADAAVHRAAAQPAELTVHDGQRLLVLIERHQFAAPPALERARRMALAQVAACHRQDAGPGHAFRGGVDGRRQPVFAVADGARRLGLTRRLEDAGAQGGRVVVVGLAVDVVEHPRVTRVAARPERPCDFERRPTGDVQP